MTGPVVWQVRPDWQEKMLPGVIDMLQNLGNEMVGEMIDLVPEGTRNYDGPRLAETLFARVVQARNAKGQWGQQELRVGADADYALDVEFGHLTVDGGTFVPAQPFIRPVVYKFHNLGKTAIVPTGADFVGNPPIGGDEE